MIPSLITRAMGDRPGWLAGGRAMTVKPDRKPVSRSPEPRLAQPDSCRLSFVRNQNVDCRPSAAMHQTQIHSLKAFRLRSLRAPKTRAGRTRPAHGSCSLIVVRDVGTLRRSIRNWDVYGLPRATDGIFEARGVAELQLDPRLGGVQSSRGVCQALWSEAHRSEIGRVRAITSRGNSS